MGRAIVAAVLVLLLYDEPSFAQFFAYVPVGALDANGMPVLEPKSGKPLADGFCLIWKPNWVNDNPDLDVLDPTSFFNRISFRADPRARTITVYQAEAPGVIAITSGPGWYPIGGTVVFKLNVTVPMLPQPKAEWPCSKETWEAALTLPERRYQTTPVVPGGSSSRSSSSGSPDRPAFAICKHPNWPGFRC